MSNVAVNLPVSNRRIDFLDGIKEHQRNIWALGDQGLISGSNFITMVLLAKGMEGGVAGFGRFTLVYAGLLFANILQTALITQPHNVLGKSRESEEYIRYTTTTCLGQLLLTAIEVLIVLALAAWAWSSGWSYTPLLFALVPSIVAWQLQELVRRILYTENRTGAAFLNDLISYGGQTGVIALLWFGQGHPKFSLHIPFTGVVALYVLSATSALSVILGLWQLRHSLGRHIDSKVLLENWNFGKWLLGSEILNWCSSLQMYLYLAGIMIGTRASGELRAAQILYGPTRVLSYFFCTMLPILFAEKLAHGGDRAMHHQFRTVNVVALPILGAYCLLISLFARPLLKLVFNADYASDPSVLVLFSGVAFVGYVQLVVAAALTAKRRTRYIFIGTLWGAAVTAVICYPSVKLMGLNGALAAMILTTAIVTVLLWQKYCHATAGSSADPQTFVPAGINRPLELCEEQAVA